MKYLNINTRRELEQIINILYTKLPRLDCYKHSLFVRIMKEWNALPSQVVEVDVSKFKCALRTHMNMFR